MSRPRPPARHRGQRPGCRGPAATGTDTGAALPGSEARSPRQDRGDRSGRRARPGGRRGSARPTGLQRGRGAVRDDLAVVDARRSRSASRSASSRYCVVSSTVGAVGDQGAHQRATCRRGRRVQPGGRLVQEQHPRPADQAGREVQPAAHAARVGLDRPSAGLGQVEALQQLAGRRRASGGQLPAAGRSAPGSPGRSAPRRRRRTGRSGRSAAHRSGSRATSKPATRARAAVGAQQGGQDAHRGGLAGAVGPSSPQMVPRLDRQVDPARAPRVEPKRLWSPMARRGISRDPRIGWCRHRQPSGALVSYLVL